MSVYTHLHLVSAAVSNDNPDELARLLQEDPECLGYYDSAGLLPLCAAAKCGALRALRWLLEQKVDCNQRSMWSQNTPLIWAALNNQKEAAEILIDAGANLALKNQGRLTALSGAIMSSHADMIDLLLRRGAHVSAQDFSWAVSRREWAIARRLVTASPAKIRSENVWLVIAEEAVASQDDSALIDALMRHSLARADGVEAFAQDICARIAVCEERHLNGYAALGDEPAAWVMTHRMREELDASAGKSAENSARSRHPGSMPI